MKARADHCYLTYDAYWHTWMVRGRIKLANPSEAHIWKNDTCCPCSGFSELLSSLLCCIKFSLSANHCPHSSTVYYDLHYILLCDLSWLCVKHAHSQSCWQIPTTEWHITNSQNRPLRRSNCLWGDPTASPSTSAQQPALRPSLHTSLNISWGLVVSCQDLINEVNYILPTLMNSLHSRHRLGKYHWHLRSFRNKNSTKDKEMSERTGKKKRKGHRV